MAGAGLRHRLPAAARRRTGRRADAGVFAPNQWLQDRPRRRRDHHELGARDGAGLADHHAHDRRRRAGRGSRRASRSSRRPPIPSSTPTPSPGPSPTAAAGACAITCAMLRKAARAAREMLMEAAAAGVGRPVSEVTTEPGAVGPQAHRPASFPTASSWTRPAQLRCRRIRSSRLRTSSAISARDVGAATRPSKVNGSGIYGMDVQVPGMLDRLHRALPGLWR